MQNDRKIKISVGSSRNSTNWQQAALMWSELCNRLSQPVRTAENYAEFMSWTKSRQDDLKDIGGFVGGTLRGPRRKADAVIGRDLVTLDFDNIPRSGTVSVLKRVDALGCAAKIYSTRKHSDFAPRLRIVIPLSHTISADEYEPIARRITEMIGLQYADPTTFEINRLMYWPSCSKDSEFVSEIYDKPFCDPDGILAAYDDWHDVTSWPLVPGAEAIRKRSLARQADPLTKRGIVGAFCRTYSITAAMDKFIPGIYEETAVPGRYTYTGGSTTGGAIIYEDDKFLYSHHATDPCSGQLVNAFDLIRLHKFADKDDTAKEGTPTAKMPSWQAMKALALDDDGVKSKLVQERQEKADRAFSEDAPPQEAGDAAAWTDQIKDRFAYDGNGNLKKTINNAVLVLENDPRLKGKIAIDEFANRGVAAGSLPWNPKQETRPWTDDDDANYANFMETYYGLKGHDLLGQALTIVSGRHRFNDVAAYFSGLKWDGVRRVDTLLVDYLGADDGPYVRAITRKELCAAVARAMKDFVKFDYMIILSGPQGIGKSTFLRYLGKNWFSDSLTTFEGKEAAELIQGVLIVEVGELAAMNRQETNSVKQFLSKVDDIYRAPYGRRTERYPRRCVFFGTSNESEFLRDVTGNRRFWPVDVGINEPTKSVWDDLPGEVDQIWAEVYQMYLNGEPLFLDRETEKLAQLTQDLHSEGSMIEGPIREYLDEQVPENWNGMSVQERRMFTNGGMHYEGKLIPKDRVCIAEIYTVVLGGDLKYIRPQNRTDISNAMRRMPDWEKAKGVVRFGPLGLQKGWIKKAQKA